MEQTAGQLASPQQTASVWARELLGSWPSFGGARSEHALVRPTPTSSTTSPAQNLPVALPDEPWRTAQCAPHPPPAVTSPPCIPQSRPGAGVPPRTPTSVVRVCTMPPLIWRYCKMFFTESAARGLIDVIDVIDHAWRPIDTPDSCCAAGPPCRPAALVAGKLSAGGG